MEQMIIETMTEFAHQPFLVYSMLFLAMYMSSFGLPIPEEVTLLTLGFLTHMALFPEAFPHPEGLRSEIFPHTAAFLAFCAIFSSDLLVFTLGRFVGPRIISHPRVSKVLTAERMGKVENWTSRYGAWAGGIFRFTPGLRFPGHLSCGMLKVPFYKFILIDGFAALISVPTQVYLVAYYGKEIIQLIKIYQPWVLAGLLVILLIVFRNEIASLFRRKKQAV